MENETDPATSETGEAAANTDRLYWYHVAALAELATKDPGCRAPFVERDTDEARADAQRRHDAMLRHRREMRAGWVRRFKDGNESWPLAPDAFPEAVRDHIAPHVKPRYGWKGEGKAWPSALRLEGARLGSPDSVLLARDAVVVPVAPVATDAGKQPGSHTRPRPGSDCCDIQAILLALDSLFYKGDKPHDLPSKLHDKRALWQAIRRAMNGGDAGLGADEKDGLPRLLDIEVDANLASDQTHVEMRPRHPKPFLLRVGARHVEAANAKGVHPTGVQFAKHSCGIYRED